MRNLIKNASLIKKVRHVKKQKLSAFCLTFGCTFVFVSGVVQATDLQIYAAPSAGQKTIIMMLDTSGSMGPVNSSGYSYRDDYNLNCGTSSQTALATSVSSLSGLTNNRAYRISSGTNPSYDRNFCYVSSSSASTSVKDEVSGCEQIKNTNGTITGYQCLDRLTRLKDGMFKLLESDDSVANTLIKDSTAKLSATYIGVGNFSSNGDGQSGQILVPAKKLGEIGSSQRLSLKNAIAGLSARNGTPSANAYAEAASYLLGTTTNANLQRYFKINNSSSYAECDSWDTDGTCIGRWNGWYSNFNSSNTTLGEAGRVGNYNGYYYYTDNPDSGFNNSVIIDTRNSSNYLSPLPSDANKASCDGQGIYFLSDGVANNTSDDRALSLMKKSLDSKSSLFSCTNEIPNADSGSAWRCMGAYSKSLFDPSKNPMQRSIQTAFVGFGSTFFTNNILTANQDTQNACRISSRAYKDAATGAAPNDKCSPGYGGALTIPSPTANNSGTGRTDGYNYDGGFGNGGFFQASKSIDVTKSVIQFINSLGDTPPDPLSTGAISVPVDALNPNGFQPYGYLRALKPDPGKNYLIWQGNLKKYGINGGALKDGSTTIFNDLGALNKNTKDLFNASNSFDLGLVEKGGVYSKLALPTTDNPNLFRPLFTDVSSVNNGKLVKISAKDSNLLAVTNKPIANNAALLTGFKTQAVVKDFSTPLKIKILNYLGYDLDLATTTTLPDILNPPSSPFTAMGGSIHSLPVQLTYSGDLDGNGDLTSVRSQSVLYSSMEGGLRVVDASTGAEQMVFVPADILEKDNASSALRRSEAGDATYGIDGAWVADPAYEFGTSSNTTSVRAKQMNVYGGMRMGGTSYYGLNVLNPNSPKFLFRIGPDLGGKYARIGQTWSKPVLANVRYGDKFKRVMIIGGGYDICYENPRFKLNTANPTEYGGAACKKAQADGNAVYMIDANDGSVLWYASNAGADSNNAAMTHSIVSRISTVDRDGDGLVDHLYFGDLGGQVFRADLNNAKGTPASGFGKRVVRLANLGSTTLTDGDQPRFYQPPTLTKHTQGSDTFILVGIASGDRSTPLDVTPLTGREGILPAKAIPNRPMNNVYGLIDRDFSNKALMTIADSDLKTVNLVLTDLKKNPQTLSGAIASSFFPYNKTGLQGWYRSLSSDYTGNDVSGRTSGGIKAFEEEPIALTNYLFVPTYDPEGTGVAQQDPCKPRIVGESNTQQFCLPYGVCLKLDGTKDIDEDKKSGFQILNGKNTNVIGAGIRGITLGPGENSNKPNSCGSLTMLGNIQGSGKWECTRILNPIRWYEKYVSAS
ncbi:PilC/PilY family type IV pilus protein [Acinetobacter guillouiae]|uniref:PilC/PilY family type IV pilus protein n=1 Tax=Acinetobacter guillouiae TaxID=106649 RepID=UPI0026E266E4|nr:PilC/PilY family type IV pilus protein [Acinetobacter guillouiae]MDO6645597.1 PilC/PilY family type IV pilus protein [Acinetobacter guillouiae]